MWRSSSRPSIVSASVEHGGIDSSLERDRVETELLGVETFTGTFDDAVITVLERARSAQGGYVVQCNVHVLMAAQKDAALMRALHGAWLVMPDGAPIAWLQRRLGGRPAQRVAGPDLMVAVIDRGRPFGLRHFFLGSTCETLASLVARMQELFPGIEIAGTHNPPFGSLHELAEATTVAVAAAPDVIWLALGAPKQELWMREHSAAVPAALVLGVGAAFDFHAGVTPRAPRWLQRLGLEWTHRLAHDPRRLTGRYVRSGSAFIRVASSCLARRGRGV